MSKLTTKKKPPVLLLGGSSNTLSIARSLGRLGIDIYISVTEGNYASYSRFIKKNFVISDKKRVDEFWCELLLSNTNPMLHGCVIFPCNDDGIEFVANHRDQLATSYILDESIPDLQLKMLNKLDTLQLARQAGVGTPQFMAINAVDDIARINSKFEFPLIIKPQHSHLFQKAFPGKLFFVDSYEQMQARLHEVLAKDLKVILSELIPGPDNLLGSYYTYIDAQGRTLFHFTKKVIRRYPKNHGQGCYHITAWDQEIAEQGLQFFRGINFRGLGNVEFKRDQRDGKLKIIECNPRFTAAHELLVRCGMDVAEIIYKHLVGLPVPQIESYREGMTLWFPVRDFQAYRELRRQNELTFAAWLRSIAHQQVLPHFRLNDPLPTLATFAMALSEKLMGRPVNWRSRQV